MESLNAPHGTGRPLWWQDKIRSPFGRRVGPVGLLPPPFRAAGRACRLAPSQPLGAGAVLSSLLLADEDAVHGALAGFRGRAAAAEVLINVEPAPEELVVGALTGVRDLGLEHSAHDFLRIVPDLHLAL